MATDMFLSIDDIKGDSQDSVHRQQMEIVGWQWRIVQSASSHAGVGSGSGKAAVHDVRVDKYLDRGLPNLTKLCCSGKHFKKAKLTVRKAGGSAVEYFTLEMHDGLVSGVYLGGAHRQTQVKETVTLNFASFTVTYTPQTKSGARGAAIAASWSIAKNAPA